MDSTRIGKYISADQAKDYQIMQVKQETKIYLPGLNGLRAVAALTVLFGHMFAPFGDWGLEPLSFRIPWPEEPVTTFFVISGFLITYLLMNEIGKTNDVSIPKFYMRRILRIWPLYYVYMILAIVAVVCLNSPMDESVWYYTFFSGNISHALSLGLIPLFHYWSLGVEEQYYIWYPWIVKYNKERIVKVVIALCVIWFGLKMGSYVFLGKGLVYKIFSITRFDCMMIGAIGAILYYKKAAWFMRMCANRVVVILAWVLFFTSGLYAQYIPAPIRAEYISVVSLLVIMAGLVSKPLLENRVMNYLGKISYGIYVIHPLLIFVGSWMVKSTNILSTAHGGGHWIVFASVSALTILLASLSYKYLEMPFLRLKDKFSVVKSTNEKM